MFRGQMNGTARPLVLAEQWTPGPYSLALCKELASPRTCTEMVCSWEEANMRGTVPLPGQAAYRQEEQDASGRAYEAPAERRQEAPPGREGRSTQHREEEEAWKPGAGKPPMTLLGTAGDVLL